MAKTTKKDFETFKAECLRWRNTLGLMDWHFYFEHKKIKGAYAETRWDVRGRVLTIAFNTSWEDREVNKEELSECALHECMHVVLADYDCEAKARYANEFDMDRAHEAVVTRMAGVIMGLAR